MFYCILNFELEICGVNLILLLFELLRQDIIMSYLYFWIF